MAKRKILVAMSGGVDSSVAAVLCLEKGFQVIGVTMELFGKEDGLENLGREKRKDFNDAAQVAKKMGFEHHVVNLSKEFSKQVISDFVDQYLAGRTPNPCVVCNRALKFGELEKKARELGCVGMATGHYARIATLENRHALLEGVDKSRDQSYFLYTLTQDLMKRVHFPLGNLTKTEVRKKAGEYALPVAKKSESREICFVPDDDYVAFLEKRAMTALLAGEIKNRGGEILGVHKGIHRYTIGQRKGLGIANRVPLYVLEINPGKNEIIVGEKKELGSSGLVSSRINWLDGSPVKPGTEVLAKIRYKQKGIAAKCYPTKDDGWEFHFIEQVNGVAPGQSVVAYIDRKVICGGPIERALV